MKILIGDLPWQVKYVNPENKKMRDGDSVYLGLTTYEKSIVRIRRGMTPELTRQTVIHELVHAFLFSYGVNPNDEEQMCDFFGSHGDDIIKMTDTILYSVG